MTKRVKAPDVMKHEETLQSPVNKSGAGEDPIVRDLLGGEMAKASDKDALDMALALQQIARGQDSILELVKQNTAEAAELRSQLAFMKKEAAERDAAVEKWQADQEKFIQGVFDRAEKLRVAGSDLDKIKANAAATAQQEMAAARLKMRDDARKFDEELARMPKETVVAPGEVVTTIINGQPAVKLMPNVIRIKHRQWTFPPGRRVSVPKIVADALYQKLESETRTEELKEVLSENLEASKLRDKMIELRKRDEAPYDPSLAPSPVLEEPSELSKL